MADNAASFIRRHGGKRAVLNKIRWRIAGWLYPPLKTKIDFSTVTRVVFVCKGNICRSPVAEYAFKQASSLECCSAGLDTTQGKPANERIKAIAKKLDIDLSNHKTTPIKAVGLVSTDLVVCMEPAHFFDLKKNHGEINVVLLGHYGEPALTYIHDPYSASHEYAEVCTRYVIDSANSLARLMAAGGEQRS